MELIKNTDNYKIYKKRSGRYCIQGSDKKWIQGDEKITILVNHKLLKVKLPKPKPETKPEVKPETETTPKETAATAEAAPEEKPQP